MKEANWNTPTAEDIAELHRCQGDLRSDTFNDVENLALNLIGFFLTKDRVLFREQVVAEMAHRLTDVSRPVIEAAYERANDSWNDAYYD